MVSKTESDIIRLRHHSSKSRAITVGAMLLILAAFAIMRVSSVASSILVLVALGLMRLARRYTTEEIRPRPKSERDRRDQSVIQAIQIASMALFAVPMLWFVWGSEDRPLHRWLGWAVALGLIAFLLIAQLTARAYRRLLDRVAKSDDAYGL